jgi:hypothetical protein
VCNYPDHAPTELITSNCVISVTRLGTWDGDSGLEDAGEDVVDGDLTISSTCDDGA